MSPGYAASCGPAVLAAVADLSREDAARLLYRAEKRRSTRAVRSGTTTPALVAVLRELGYTVARTNFRTYRATSRWVGTPRITLGTFLRERSGGWQIIEASGHFVLARDGEVIEDNGSTPWMGRVAMVLDLAKTNGGAAQ